MSSECRPKDSSETKCHCIFVVGALLIVALAQVVTLFGPFAGDDFFNLLNALNSRESLWDLMQGFNIRSSDWFDGWLPPHVSDLRYFRPVFLLSLLADHALWGVKAWGYHLTNILLHLCVTYFFFLVFRELSPAREKAALVAAVLFGLMDYHNTTVGWISGRTEILSGLGIIVAIWSFLRFTRSGRFTYYVLSLTAALIAFFSKENALILPLLIISVWWLGSNRSRPSFWWLVPFMAAVVPYLILRSAVLGGFHFPPKLPYYDFSETYGFLAWVAAKSVCVFYTLLLQGHLFFPTELFLAKSPRLLVLFFIFAVPIVYYLMREIQRVESDDYRRIGWLAVLWMIIPLMPTAPLPTIPFYFYVSLMGLAILYVVMWEHFSRKGPVAWVTRPRLRRVVGWILLLLFASTLQFANVVLLKGSLKSMELLDQIDDEWPLSEQKETEIYLIDVPYFIGPTKAALHFLWPERTFKLHYLTVAPYSWKFDAIRSSIRQLDPFSLEVTASGPPYFSGIYGLFALGIDERRIIRDGWIDADGYQVMLKGIEPFGVYGRRTVRQCIFRFQEPIRNPVRLFLYFTWEKGFQRLNIF